MTKAVIVDDSNHAVDLLCNLLEKSEEEIELAGIAGSVPQGIELISGVKPDLVFLDVELGDQTGFDLLSQLPDIDFNLIFTTAHNKYAIDAFRYNAVHFLLKPIHESDLMEALKRVLKPRDIITNSALNGIKRIIDDYGSRHSKKLSLATEEGIRFINTEDIVYVQADGSYSRVKMSNGTSYVLSRLLKDFEQQLNKSYFYRLSKSYLINMHQVEMYRRIDGGTVEMTDGTLIPVPRRKREEFMIKMTEFID